MGPAHGAAPAPGPSLAAEVAVQPVHSSGARSATWALAGDLGARVTFYPRDFSQPSHAHAEAQISILLAGSVGEDVGKGEEGLRSGAIFRRPPGARHAVRFGRTGALMLSVEQLRTGSGHQPPAGAPPARMANLLATGLRSTPPRPSADVPAWLDAARAALEAGPATVADLARDLGVHPVHLSRSFLRIYGLRPSVFRLRSMTAKALALALGEDVALAAAAQEAGFSDQAHLSRAVSALCGIPVGQLRRSLSLVTQA